MNIEFEHLVSKSKIWKSFSFFCSFSQLTLVWVLILGFILSQISRVFVSLITYVYGRINFLFCAGNQVQLLEAKQCFYVIPGYCNTWKNFVCVLTCKGVCKSFSAHGECRDDRGCHCRCCWLNYYIQQWNIHCVKLLNKNYINKVWLHCIFLLFSNF